MKQTTKFDIQQVCQMIPTNHSQGAITWNVIQIFCGLLRPIPSLQPFHLLIPQFPFLQIRLLPFSTIEKKGFSIESVESAQHTYTTTMSAYNHPGEFPAPTGSSQYTDPYGYAQQQPPVREKTHEEKILEKSRKWQQLQSKRYGEKRKFGNE